MEQFYKMDKRKMKKWYYSLDYRELAGFRIMYPGLTFEEMYNRMMSRFGFILKPPEILLKSEKKKLIKNPDINPITGRKIKPYGKTYQKLMKMIVYGD